MASFGVANIVLLSVLVLNLLLWVVYLAGVSAVTAELEENELSASTVGNVTGLAWWLVVMHLILTIVTLILLGLSRMDVAAQPLLTFWIVFVAWLGISCDEAVVHSRMASDEFKGPARAWAAGSILVVLASLAVLVLLSVWHLLSKGGSKQQLSFAAGAVAQPTGGPTGEKAQAQPPVAGSIPYDANQQHQAYGAAYGGHPQQHAAYAMAQYQQQQQYAQYAQHPSYDDRQVQYQAPPTGGA